MELQKEKVYYKDQHPKEWEYVQNNNVGRISVMWMDDEGDEGDEGYTFSGTYTTPYSPEGNDYAFMLMPKRPKPKTLLEKVEELNSWNDIKFHAHVLELVETHEGPIR